MTPIVQSIEIARRPEDVFAYATDFSRFPEWQNSVLSASPEDSAPLAVGARAAVTRRVGPRKLLTTEEIQQLDPPRAWTARGVGGLPVTTIATGTIEPLDHGKRSRVTIALEFHGRGLGKLLVALVIRRQAHQQLQRNIEKLKQQLEQD
jgi:uncharacterized protein YndB with AHSA1/START domain